MNYTIIIRKTIVTFLLTNVITLASNALETQKPYIKTEIGFSAFAKNPNKRDYYKKPKGTYLYEIGVGYKFTPHFRGEISYLASGKYKYNGFVDGEQQKQNIRNNVVMLNGYYDFNTYGNFTPYLIFGLGLSSNQSSNFDITKNQQTITVKGHRVKGATYQVGPGFLYRITKTVSLDLSYKLSRYGEISTTKVLSSNGQSIESEHKIKGRMLNHNLCTGFIFNF